LDICGHCYPAGWPFADLAPERARIDVSSPTELNPWMSMAERSDEVDGTIRHAKLSAEVLRQQPDCLPVLFGILPNEIANRFYDQTLAFDISLIGIALGSASRRIWKNRNCQYFAQITPPLRIKAR